MIFSSAGRVGPVRFALVAVAAWCAWRASVLAFEWGGTATYVLTGAALGAVLAWLVAEAARRLHDTGRSGWWGLTVALVLVAPLVAITLTSFAYQPRSLMPVLAAVVGVIAAALMLRPGARASNAHGEPPAGPLAHAAPAGGPSARRSAVWAGVSVLGCALLAYGIISISNGMRDAHARDLRFEKEHAR